MVQKSACLFITFLLFANVILGQQKSDISQLENELLKSELQKQANAKFGNNSPKVQTITDTKKIATIRQSVIKNIDSKKRKMALEESKNLTLSQRYKNGDKTVVSSIIKILQGNNKEQRVSIYNDLSKKYDDKDSYTIIEPELIQQLLNGIDNPEDEVQAIQLAGISELKGYKEKFEERLLSGKSVDEGRLFFWLSKEASSYKCLEFIEKKIKTKKISPLDLNQVLNGIEIYALQADSISKNKIGNLALFIYENKLISEERIEDLKNSAMTSDAAESLLTCLFEYGDEKVIPIANDILKRSIRLERPIKALIRLEGVKHLDKVYKYLSDEETYYIGLDIISILDKKNISDTILKEILIRKSKHKNIDDNDVRRVIELYKENDAEKYLLNPLLIISEIQLANRITNQYNFSLISADEILKDLLSLKLVTKVPKIETVEKIKKDNKDSPFSFALEVLEKENVSMDFDTETDFLPVNYDELLDRFGSISSGAFKDVLIWMDTKETKNNFKYKITVVTNKQVYITEFSDNEDWYNIALVENLLEKILKDAGVTNRFVSVNTVDQTSIYVYGNPQSVAQFIEKYNR
jgi:hypothetical protein